MRPDALWLRRTVVWFSLLAWLTPAAALAQNEAVRMAGVVSEERIAHVIAKLSKLMPMIDLSYKQLSSAQIAAESKRTNPSFDLALFSSPDIAVSVANEGYAAHDEFARAETQWRQEVFGLWSDPAVMVLQQNAFVDDMPHNRIELVRALEQRSDRFWRRVGIVNIGIDDISYFLASQDSIRTSLYWRLMRAFGAASARIFDTTDDLLEAFRQGDVDILYNVPLSALQAGNAMPAGTRIIVPQDYVLAVPWTILVPQTARNLNGGCLLLHNLTSKEVQPALATAGFTYPVDFAAREGLQRIELGPELLVFRDTIKRSKFLDMWFEMTVN